MNLRRGVLQCVLAAAWSSLAVMGLQGEGTAQSRAKGAASSNNPPSTSSASGVSFGVLDLANRTVDRTVVQLRRFFEGNGQVITVREEVRVDADGTNSAPYSLTFLGVEGELQGSTKWQLWAQNYTRFANLFHQHGGFHVHNLALAQANYTVHDFGPSMRAGHVTERIVVFPNSLDKAIWLLEVDAATSLPLYTAEYDANFRLLSEIEAVTFASSVQLTTPNTSLMTVTTHANFAVAKQSLNTTGLVEPSASFTGEYQLHKVQVADNPLNTRRSLVLTYTDGVDEFFVIESPGVSEFFAGLPSQAKSGARPANTMARYRDPSMSVLLFWDDGVGFQVAGRGSLRRLDGIAKSVYTQALLSP